MPSNTDAPRVDRPDIPPEYTHAGRELLDWSHVEERLRSATTYWIATVGPECRRPRVRPVSGLFVDGVIRLSGNAKSHWVRELTANPSVTVHLDLDDTDTVIVEGEAEILGPGAPETAHRLADMLNAKYSFANVGPDYYARPGHIAVRPGKVLAWSDFNVDPTRFLFE